MLYDRTARSEAITRWTAGAAVHQANTLTWLDRYPRLFAAAQAELGEAGDCNILSFGCSSGEEVQSLRRYFPDATLTGAELNTRQLAACARWPADPRIAFIRSSRDAIAVRGPYDAIFCLAVLQRAPHVVETLGLRTIARRYPFERFADEIRFLASQLRDGGILVVDHCQYRVEDVDAPLTPLDGDTVYAAKGPRFDRDGVLIVPQAVVARLFRRTPDR